MVWKRLRKATYLALCGSVVFQTAGCESLVASLVSNLVSSYVTEAIMSGFVY